VVANYRAAGARCVVVSGIVDAPHRLHADLVPGAVLTVCRLRVDRDELRRRFLGRGESAEVGGRGACRGRRHGRDRLR
jgi:hypothetical protein